MKQIHKLLLICLAAYLCLVDARAADSSIAHQPRMPPARGVPVHMRGYKTCNTEPKAQARPYQEDLTTEGIEPNPGPSRFDIWFRSAEAGEDDLSPQPIETQIMVDDPIQHTVTINPMSANRFKVEVIMQSPDSDVVSVIESAAREEDHWIMNATWNAHQLAIARHETVCSAISKDTSDSDLDSWFTLPADSGLEKTRLTPDFMFTVRCGSEDVLIVLEVTTCASQMYMASSWQLKADKYSDVLRRRATYLKNKNITAIKYHILVVSPEAVMSSFTIDDNDASALYHAYKIGISIESEGYRAGYIELDDTGKRRSALVAELQAAAKRIQATTVFPEGRAKGIITQPFVENLEHMMVYDEQRSDRMRDIIDDLIRSGNVYAGTYRRPNVAEAVISRLDSRIREYEQSINADLSDTLDGIVPNDNGYKLPHDMKSVAQFPLLVPEPTTKRESKRTIYEGPLFGEIVGATKMEQVIADCWTMAHFQAIGDTESFRESTVEDLEDAAMKSSDEYKDGEFRNKRDRNRVDLVLEDGHKKELAKDGVFGKKHATDLEKLVEEKYSRLPFRCTHDTKDIDLFINDEDLSAAVDESWGVLCDLEAIDKANGFELSSALTGGVTNSVCRQSQTKLVAGLTLISEIIEEVNVSFSQFCKPEQMVYKKLRNADIYLLVKPTSMDKSIFFSIAWRTAEFRNYELPFMRTLHADEEWSYTKFSSINRHKLQSMMAANVKYVCFLNLFGELRGEQIHTSVFSADAVSHARALLMMMVEGKTGTAAMLQNFRYAYMEMTRPTDMFIDPGKILSKFPEVYRSRYQVWAYKKFISCFSQMCAIRPFLRSPEQTRSDTESRINYDRFENLISWVTLRPVSSLQEAINLSYFGVVKNKDDSVKIHGLYKIFSKIASEEMSMSKAQVEYTGYIDRRRLMEPGFKGITDTQYKSHEFSVTWTIAMGEIIKRQIRKNHSLATGQYRPFIYNAFADSVAVQTIDQYATYKASAQKPDDEFYIHGVTKSKPSIRTLEAANKYSAEPNFNVRPLLDIESFLTDVENGHMYASMFKKNQLTGVREIFILEFKARVLINYLETLMRSICKLIPQEMMTKGQLKMKKNAMHMHATKAAEKGLNLETPVTITASNSDDATTWAQKFLMTMFASFLGPILPPELRSVCYRILNCVANKKLVLPSELLDQFYKNPEIRSTDKVINELKSQFLGRSTNSNLIKPSTIILKNVSNMMQGILHYLSGLYHTGHLLMLEEINARIFNTLCVAENILMLCTLTQTSKASSDDSSVTWSITCPRTYHNAFRNLITLFSSIKALSYPLCGCLQSESKSTSVSFGVEEFNSVFSVMNTTISPKIKFVWAAVSMPLQGSFDSRQVAYSNLRRQIVENGGSQYLASVVQCAQKYTHYACLGYTTSPLFRRYYEQVLRLPSPVLGYFAEEPEQICGVFGFGLAEHILTRKYDGCWKIMQYLMQNGDAEFNGDKRPTISFSLNFGDSKKYKEFLFRLFPGGVPDKWMNEPMENDNVAAYFRPPESKSSVEYKIREKAFAPGAKENFSFKTLSQMLSSAVYVLHSPCVTIREKQADKTFKINKRSLLWLVQDAVVRVAKMEIDVEFMTLFYPNHHTYSTVYEKWVEMQELCIGVATTNMKSERYITFTSLPHFKMASRSLQSVVMQLWAGMISMSSGELSASFAQYKKHIPWLQESMKATMDHNDCPFEDAMSLARFVRELDVPVSKFKILSSSNNHLGLRDTVDDLMTNNYLKGHSLVRRATLEQDASSSSSSAMVTEKRQELDRVNHVLIAMRESGLSRDNIRRMLGKLLTRKESYMSVSESVGPNMRSLCFIMELLRSDRIISFTEAIKSVRYGEYSKWQHPQKRIVRDGKVQWEGYGLYTGIISEGEMDVLFTIRVDDDRMVELTVNDVSRLLVNINGMIKIFKRLKSFGFRTTSQGAPRRRYFNTCDGRLENRGLTDTIHLEVSQKLMMPVIEDTRAYDLSLTGGILRLGVLVPRRSETFYELKYHPTHQEFPQPKMSPYITKYNLLTGIKMMPYLKFWLSAEICPAHTLVSTIALLKSFLEDNTRLVLPILDESLTITGHRPPMALRDFEINELAENATNIIDFLKNSLTARLNKKRLIPYRTEIALTSMKAEEIDPGVLTFDEEWLLEAIGRGPFSMSADSKDDVELLGGMDDFMPDYLEESTKNMDVFETVVAEELRESEIILNRNIAAVSTMWDDYIERIKADCVIKDLSFKKVMTSGSSATTTLELTSWLLDLAPEDDGGEETEPRLYQLSMSDLGFGLDEEKQGITLAEIGETRSTKTTDASRDMIMRTSDPFDMAVDSLEALVDS